MNLQVIVSPEGEILWVSGALPGSVHDLTAARIWGIVRRLAAAGLIVLADKGYIGAGEHVLTPYRGRTKPARKRLPIAPTLGCASRASMRTPSSRPGTSCANYAAAPGAPGGSPRPSTSFNPRDHRMKTLNPAWLQ
jgi:DDE superfamily endonuclease